MNEGEGLVEFRPTCSKVDCEEPPLSGRYLCRRHEAEVAMAVAPGIPESRWAGGVPEAEAMKRAAELEKQYEAQAIADVARYLVREGGMDETAAREEAERRVRVRPAPRPPGPDPDTSYTVYPAEALRAVKSALEGEQPPTGPTEELAFILECLKGRHGAIRETVAAAMMAAVAQGLRSL